MLGNDKLGNNEQEVATIFNSNLFINIIEDVFTQTDEASTYTNLKNFKDAVQASIENYENSGSIRFIRKIVWKHYNLNFNVELISLEQALIEIQK